MGITGLLPLLKKSSREAHLREFRGQTAAVDAYVWLHKGAFSCADKLAMGEPTDGYVLYMMKQLNQLLNHDIKPILVFDGCNLPSKAGTEAKRRENRERNRIKAKELLREGKTREARDCFQRCVDVTSEMAAEVIAACRARNIDIIVAPYEADAQLAFLNLQGIADLIITEDSDLVLFGCKNVMFKVDNNGGGVLVEHEKLHSAMNLPRDKFTFDKFRNMCILSGCDYLPSLHGIGLAKAAKFFTLTSNPDVYNALCKLPSYLKMPHLEVTVEYREGFIKAQNTFLYQLIFDPITRKIRPLTDYPEDKSAEDFPYAGGFIGHERGLQIALGNVNVQTGETTDNFDPSTYKAKEQKSTDWSKKKSSKLEWSIWSTSYEVKKAQPDLGFPKIGGGIIDTTKGKEMEVKLPSFKRKRQSDVVEETTEISEEDNFQNLYGVSVKKSKPIIPDEDTLNNLEYQHEERKEIKNEKDDYTEHNNTGSASPVLKSMNPFAKCRSPSKEVLPARKFSALKRFGQIKKTTLDNNTIVHSKYFSPPSFSQKDEIKQETPESENASLDTLSQLLSDDEEPTTQDSPKSPSHHDVKLKTSPSQDDVKSEKSPSQDDVKSEKCPSQDDVKSEKSPSQHDVKSEESPSQHDVKLEKSPLKSDIPLQSNAKKSFSWNNKLSGFSFKKVDQIKVENSHATNFSFKAHSQISERTSKSPSKSSCNSPFMNVNSNSNSPSESKENSVTDDDTIKENTEEIQEDNEQIIHNSIALSQKSCLSSYSDIGSIDNESFNLSQESTKSEYFSSQNSLKKESPKTKSPNLFMRKPLQPNVKNVPLKNATKQPGLSKSALKNNPKSKQLSLKDMFAKKAAPK